MSAPHPEDAPGTSPVDPPVTGDRSVDDALAALARGLDAEPAAQVEAVTEAHRALQARLTSPAPAPAPGEARPEPPRR